MKSLILILAAASLAGCKLSPTQMFTAKSTVFGLEVASADAANGGTPSFKLGLIRTYVTAIPTATNTVYAAPLETHTDATITMSKQTVVEDIKTK